MNVRRVLRPVLEASVAVLLIGGVVLVVLVRFFRLYAATATTDATLRPFRLRVAWEILKTFRTDATEELARAEMRIINNEYDREKDLQHQIGDVGAAGGPSIGVGQVERVTAKELGLWTPSPDVSSPEEERATYGALATQPGWSEGEGIAWSVVVLRSKWLATGKNVERALELYNGSGAGAREYYARTVTFGKAEGWLS